jgi:hypothetical protein
VRPAVWSSRETFPIANKKTVGVLVLGTLAAAIAVRRRPPREDLGIVLVELVAAVADLVSAYQDAVAEEAYLGSFRRRRRSRRR